MIFLSSCNSPKFKPQVLCDISFKFNRCRCRCYDLNNLQTLDPQKCRLNYIGPAWNLDLEECDEISGFYLKSWSTHLIPKAKEIKRWGQDTCRNKSLNFENEFDTIELERQDRARSNTQYMEVNGTDP